MNLTVSQVHRLLKLDLEEIPVPDPNVVYTLIPAEVLPMISKLALEWLEMKQTSAVDTSTLSPLSKSIAEGYGPRTLEEMIDDFS